MTQEKSSDNVQYRLTTAMHNFAKLATKCGTLEFNFEPLPDGTPRLKIKNPFNSWGAYPLTKLQEICKPLDLTWWVGETDFWEDEYLNDKIYTISIVPIIEH